VTAPPSHRTSLGELARLFLTLGATAFGGPAAHVAMMEDEVVRRRQWLTRAQFLDYLGATNLIPAPARPSWPSTSATPGRGGPGSSSPGRRSSCRPR
jgi:hypothetical protein